MVQKKLEFVSKKCGKMLDKEKYKKFLTSHTYSDDIKVFIITVIKEIYENPTYARILIYFYDLDILKNIKSPDSYYIIDFDFLNYLNEKVRKNYLTILEEHLLSDIYDNTHISFLIDSGIIISDVEYLKKKRQRKLDKIKEKEEDDVIFGFGGDFFNLND